MAKTMPRAIVDLDAFVESNNIMVYGDTGAGKTELVAQLPGKVLVIRSENGTIVIRKALARLGLSKAEIAKEMKRFKVWPIRKWADLEECYTWCAENPGVFDWYAIDSATSLDQRAMRAAMEVAVNRNPEKRDIDLPDRGEHQKRQNAMKRMITDFNELPGNVLWLAQAMRREDQDGNEIVVPFITGKDYEVSAFACAQMQAFGYFMKKRSKGKKGGTDRVILWESFADKESGINYWSKDRYDVFPKITTMVKDGVQVMTFGDLLDMVTPEALSKALSKISNRDDDDDTPDITDDDTPDEDDEELESEEPEDEDADEADESDEDDDDDEQDDGPDEYQSRQQELLAMKPAQLKVAVEAAGMTVKQFKGVPMADIVAAVLEAEFDGTGMSDEPEDEDEDEDDEDLDLDEMMEDEDEEPEPEPAKPAKKVAKKAVVTPIRKSTKRIRAK